MDKAEEKLRKVLKATGRFTDNDCDQVLILWQQYARQVSKEKCESCVFSYHNRIKGHHEVEDFYRKEPGDDDGQTFSPAI